MIEKAHKMGLLTTPYAFNQKLVLIFILAHMGMGLTTSGSIGARTAVSLEESVVHVQNIADAASRINPDAIVLLQWRSNLGSKRSRIYTKEHPREFMGFMGHQVWRGYLSNRLSPPRSKSTNRFPSTEV